MSLMLPASRILCPSYCTVLVLTVRCYRIGTIDLPISTPGRVTVIHSVYSKHAVLGVALLHLGFYCKMPCYPLHTWLSETHVESTTEGSIILAGIYLKVGCYQRNTAVVLSTACSQHSMRAPSLTLYSLNGRSHPSGAVLVLTGSSTVGVLTVSRWDECMLLCQGRSPTGGAGLVLTVGHPLVVPSRT